ncbi:hypothetical protein [Compostimonas suwonensis]|uniref:Transcriptional regulator, AbiEi antitoxin, Type IV TA system n=1 Tax=Compostimonas suwonensis TaxID=1048394 RepID=A0A2M9BCP4_9MICO|nr:hypothetical protein [Compostimonas suwonensis]PJJ55715.1 hypothetical protein CLV54_3066 [Compostimonas suwonensis]
MIRRADLLDLGLSQRVVENATASGELVHVRHGCFVLGEIWRASGDGGRHRLVAAAAARAARHPLVFSHATAAALHGLPRIGRWPRTVHVRTTGAAGGSSSRTSTAHRGGSAPEIVTVEGLHATCLARTLIDIATSESFLVAVAMLDHALRVDQEREQDELRRLGYARPALTVAELGAELERANLRTGVRAARAALDFASPLAGSPGESLSRVRMLQLGFEVPELQTCFPNAAGHDRFVDFFWRSVRIIGEFDGRLKYTRGRVLGDRDPADVVLDEKLREDALRPHVSRLLRWDWDRAFSPTAFHAFLTEHGVPRA